MKIGIIGHAEDKFTEETKQKAVSLIRKILYDAARPVSAKVDVGVGQLEITKPTKEVILVSGRSPLGGIDVWAEEIALALDIETDIKAPKQNRWNAEYGYRQRNIDIAISSDILHVIVVEEYPPNYNGRRFPMCYHCNKSDHVKSGACWTAKQALALGKQVVWHIIRTNASIEAEQRANEEEFQRRQLEAEDDERKRQKEQEREEEEEEEQRRYEEESHLFLTIILDMKVHTND